jgi:hypothetical protein
MGYFGDMENLKKRFGPMAEIEVSGKTAYISEGTFDIYSNGNKAVLVKAGAVPVFPL